MINDYTPPSLVARKPYTLLVVEDDNHLLEGIRDILELEGYRVEIATNGAEGIEALKALRRPPDLIISDIMMPRMDGYEFYAAVEAHEEWRYIPFIFLTAKGEKADVRRAYKDGVLDYVVKPMDPEELLTRVESKLKYVQKNIERTQQNIANVKGEILTILNHEFRTPLTYMVAYSDMLNSDTEGLLDDDLKQFVRGINNGADRFRRLVENFITLVELEVGEAQLNYAKRKQLLTDVRGICNAALLNNQVFAQEGSLTIEIDVPDTLPGFTADPTYLTTVLTQLLENAIKFTDEPGGRVALRVSHDDDQVRFEVQDWGRGIEEEYFELIWQPFFQIKRSQYEDQGAGAGLAYVQGLVKLHGGTTHLESTFGEGSTFTILLPLGEREAPPLADDDTPVTSAQAILSATEEPLNATIETVTVLRMSSAAALIAAQQNPVLQPYLGPSIGFDTVIVKTNQLEDLQRALAEHGITATLAGGNGA